LKNIKATLPCILTFANLSLGVTAILLAVNESATEKISFLFFASLLVMIAALTDRFDGKVARMLDAASDLGKELDSLSDLISFGVAPVIIAWKLSFTGFGVAGYLIALIFPIAGAMRLARYNITAFDNVFRGMPITMAGAFLTIDNLLDTFYSLKNRLTVYHSIVTAVLILVLSYLMVSKIRIKKL